MKKIEKKIFKTKVNIIITILWIIFSGVYWKNLDISNYEQIAKESINASYVAFDVESENGYILNVIDDLEKSELEKMTVKVYNETHMSNYYQMALKLEKKCDYSKLNILVNETKYNLSDILVKEDNDFNYFIIGENELSDKEDIYELSLYINSYDVDSFIGQDYLIEFVELSSVNA